ncbi:hypothetical protein FA15DRAFT_592882 [Coprinopsis marcescibilis]|uniref:DUF8021 domain-containing protein n=1 Tax=Coprinopsis marcescibilis TaxID=230819 RepID=A0A5C3KUB8_COPMA|nr:hypothetical protein FA15DRAFT_592882 [Coprinopsis marcescibilis]
MPGRSLFRTISSLLAIAGGSSVLAQRCTYTSLQALTAAYVSAQVAGDPSLLLPQGLTTSTLYTENFVPTSLTSAHSILTTPLAIDHKRSLHDTTQCATYTEIVVASGPSLTHHVIGTQIRLSESGKEIGSVDSIVTTEGDWLFNATSTLYWASREDWSSIPATRRDSRETIKAGGDAYLSLFNDSSVQVPWGVPCNRLEGGNYNDDVGECNNWIPEGVPIVNRQYVIDETVGAVDIFCDFAGPGGVPDSHEFRLEGGKLRFVHTMTYMRGRVGGRVRG